jgi:nitrate reductase beta subunit
VTEEEMRQNPTAYNKTNLDSDHFHKVINKVDFEADISGAENEEEIEDEYVYIEDYEKEIKKFDRSFKQVYVGYADGIDIDHLDSTGNWQFQI